MTECHISATDVDMWTTFDYVPVWFWLCAVQWWYELGFSRSRSYSIRITVGEKM